MEISEKYKINLRLLSLFKNISSLGAFRVIITVDCLLCAINSTLIADIIDYVYESALLRLAILSVCMVFMLSAVYLDVFKMTIIEKGRFLRTMNFFKSLKRYSYIVATLGYTLFLALDGYCIFLDISGRLDELSEKYMFADKFLNRGLVKKVGGFFGLAFILYMHYLMFWGIGQLPKICRMVRIEQEDVIVTSMHRDYLEEGFIYDEGIREDQNFDDDKTDNKEDEDDTMIL